MSQHFLGETEEELEEFVYYSVRPDRESKQESVKQNIAALSLEKTLLLEKYFTICNATVIADGIS
jgi:hypothetical protein